MAGVNVQKKFKKANWDPLAIKAMIMSIEANYSAIKSKYGSSCTKIDKAKAWAIVEERVNSVAKITRTVKEIKKKWTDFSSAIKNKEAKRRKEARKTGGGAPPDDLSEIEEKVIALIGDEAIDGVAEGIDSLDEDLERSIKPEATIAEQLEGDDVPSPGPSEPEPSTSSQVFHRSIVHGKSAVGRQRQSVAERVLASGWERPNLNRLEELEEERLKTEKERLKIERVKLALEKARFNLAVAKSGITEIQDYASLFLSNLFPEDNF